MFPGASSSGTRQPHNICGGVPIEKGKCSTGCNISFTLAIVASGLHVRLFSRERSELVEVAFIPACCKYMGRALAGRMDMQLQNHVCCPYTEEFICVRKWELMPVCQSACEISICVQNRFCCDQLATGSWTSSGVSLQFSSVGLCCPGPACFGSYSALIPTMLHFSN